MKHTFTCLGLLLVLMAAARSEILVIDLDGTAVHDGWENFNASNFPGTGSFPGSSAWSTTLGSNASGSGDAAIARLSGGSGGGPYVASSSLYFGGFNSDPVFGGTLSVQDATPVANLENVVFQITIGEFEGVDFYNGIMPVLNYNGGSQALASTYSLLVSQVQSGTFTDPETEEEVPVYLNTWALQWDLSSIVDPVTSFSIVFSGVQHAQIYEVSLDQSDVFTQVIPEPSTYALLVLGGASLICLHRHRSRSSV